MLVKLLPEQIMNYWELVKDSFNGSMPERIADNPDSLLRIQTQLVAGVMQCWVPVIKGNGDIPEILGFVTTKVVQDEVTGEINLMVFSLYLEDSAGAKEWKGGFDTLRKFAKSRGCSNIIGYTNEKKIIKAVEMFGGGVEYSFVTIPV